MRDKKMRGGKKTRSFNFFVLYLSISLLSIYSSSISSLTIRTCSNLIFNNLKVAASFLLLLHNYFLFGENIY